MHRVLLSFTLVDFSTLEMFKYWWNPKFFHFMHLPITGWFMCKMAFQDIHALFWTLKKYFMTFIYFILGERLYLCQFPCVEDNLNLSGISCFLLPCELWVSNSVLYPWQQESLLTEPSCCPTWLIPGSVSLGGDVRKYQKKRYIALTISRSGEVAAPVTLFFSYGE